VGEGGGRRGLAAFKRSGKKAPEKRGEKGVESFEASLLISLNFNFEEERKRGEKGEEGRYGGFLCIFGGRGGDKSPKRSFISLFQPEKKKEKKGEGGKWRRARPCRFRGQSWEKKKRKEKRRGSLATSRNVSKGGKRKKEREVPFLYSPPPSLPKEKKNKKEKKKGGMGKGSPSAPSRYYSSRRRERGKKEAKTFSLFPFWPFHFCRRGTEKRVGKKKEKKRERSADHYDRKVCLTGGEREKEEGVIMFLQ